MVSKLATHFDGNPDRFKRLDRETLTGIFSNPTWYLDSALKPLIEEYFVGEHDDKDDDWKREKRDFIALVADLLAKGAVCLGTSRGEGYNDDDRAKFIGGKVEWIGKPHTIVIHHTNTPQDTPYWIINSMHLLRLYSPHYSAKVPYFYGSDTQPNGVESGHYFQGEGIPRHQTFIGYHHLVRADGSSYQTLRDEYVGFHAGDWGINVRSIGIAIVDELNEKWPALEALNEVAGIIRAKIEHGIIKDDLILIGHKEVKRPDGTLVDTKCPGDKWSGWKEELLKLIHN